MANKKHTLWLTEETRRLLGLIGGRYEDAVSTVLRWFVEKGGESVEYPRRGMSRVLVSDNVWRVSNVLKSEMGYKRVDDLVFDAVVGYLTGRGVDVHCILSILNL